MAENQNKKPCQVMLLQGTTQKWNKVPLMIEDMETRGMRRQAWGGAITRAPGVKDIPNITITAK
jgi:hypothetical protein